MTETLNEEISSIFQRALFSAVTETPVNTHPFPFLCGRIDNPAIKDIFSVMRRRFPLLTELDPKIPIVDPEQFRSLVHLLDISDQSLNREWNSVFTECFTESFSSLLVEKFIAFIPRYNRLNFVERMRAGISSNFKSCFSPLNQKEKLTLLSMSKVGDWMFTSDRGQYVLPPHTDHPRKMVTFLLYLTEPRFGNQPPGTSLYVPLSKSLRAWDSYRVKRNQFAEVLRTRHVEGHFLAFVKSDISWHGVELGATSTLTRMTINLTVQRPRMLGGFCKDKNNDANSH
jgi:hypothetical protein